MIPGLWKKCLFAGLRQPAFVHFCRYTPQGDVGYAFIAHNIIRSICSYTPQGDVGIVPPEIRLKFDQSPITPRKGT